MTYAKAMTRNEAVEMLAHAAEDADLSDDADALFTAIYGRAPDGDDGDAGELISMCYADPDVAARTREVEPRMDATMSNVPYAVYTGEGSELGSGMSEREALASARRYADERGETIDVYQGSRFVASVEPRLTGHEAIEAAERTGVQLRKYADPVDGAREITIAEAREIAAEDPSLVYVEVG